MRLPSDGDHSGRTLGDEERSLLAEVIASGTLNSTRGQYVARFERGFAAWLGLPHAYACASGSAAMHCCIAALALAPGDEVITTPITDMGAITPILYEGGVPVFADVEPATLNCSAATIAAQCTERTRAVIVTHLFGLPVDLEPILRWASARGIVVIEDCAQAYGATVRGRKVGSFGAMAAFSLQQGKHITTGEGGLVATGDAALARRLYLFLNKGWGYGDPEPDHYFPALNYRLSELQGAVGLGQLPKLGAVLAQRREVAAALTTALTGLPGLSLPRDPEHGSHAYWKYAIGVDATVLPGGASALGRRLQQQGIACAPRYIQKPAFECQLFRDWSRSPVTAMPLRHNPRSLGAQPPFVRQDYPGAVAALERVLVLPINERYTEVHTQFIADQIASAVAGLVHA